LIIAVDAGHGGINGAIGITGKAPEKKNYTLRFANELGKVPKSKAGAKLL